MSEWNICILLKSKLMAESQALTRKTKQKRIQWLIGVHVAWIYIHDANIFSFDCTNNNFYSIIHILDHTLFCTPHMLLLLLLLPLLQWILPSSSKVASLYLWQTANKNGSWIIFSSNTWEICCMAIVYQIRPLCSTPPAQEMLRCKCCTNFLSRC